MSCNCSVCHAESDQIKLVEAPRPITVDDCGADCFDRYRGGLVIAHAVCAQCGAKYTAWVGHDFPTAGITGRFVREPHQGGPSFVDLSFRSSFSDAPAPEDLPDKQTLKQIYIERQMKEAAELRERAEGLLKEARGIEEAAPDGEHPYEIYRLGVRP